MADKNNKKKRRKNSRIKPAEFRRSNAVNEQTPAKRVSAKPLIGRRQSIRMPDEQVATNEGHLQSNNESIRKRLSTIENNFELLDSQLDVLEQQLKIEPLLAENDPAVQQEVVAPRKPR